MVLFQATGFSNNNGENNYNSKFSEFVAPSHTSVSGLLPAFFFVISAISIFSSYVK